MQGPSEAGEYSPSHFRSDPLSFCGCVRRSVSDLRLRDQRAGKDGDLTKTRIVSKWVFNTYEEFTEIGGRQTESDKRRKKKKWDERQRERDGKSKREERRQRWRGRSSPGRLYYTSSLRNCFLHPDHIKKATFFCSSYFMTYGGGARWGRSVARSQWVANAQASAGP